MPNRKMTPSQLSKMRDNIIERMGSEYWRNGTTEERKRELEKREQRVNKINEQYHANIRKYVQKTKGYDTSLGLKYEDATRSYSRRIYMGLTNG